MDLVGSNKIENCKSVSNKYIFILPNQKAIKQKLIIPNQIYRNHVPDRACCYSLQYQINSTPSRISSGHIPHATAQYGPVAIWLCHARSPSLRLYGTFLSHLFASP